MPLHGHQVHSMRGRETPRGKTRHPSCVGLQRLLEKSHLCHQNGRAISLLRGPIWQSPRRAIALTWASLAQTCLAAMVIAQEGAGCARLGDATGTFLASAPLLPCLCT